MSTEQENSSEIKLGELLRFDSLREKYPDKRIKLRFNVDWSWQDENGETIWYNQVQEYKNSQCREDSSFYQLLYSLGDNRKKHQDNEIVFQFIKIGWKSWLLIDARIIIDAEGCKHKDGWLYPKAESLPEYIPVLGRLVVNFPNPNRSGLYVEPDIVDNIPVDTILNEHFTKSAEAFCGYENVCKTYNELKRIIDRPEWWTALSSIYGVYVITDRAAGKMYVGSAYGDNGVAGRWSVYLSSGYDKDEKETGEYPNERLRSLVQDKGMAYIQENFKYTLLEFFPKTEAGKKKALERESYWKDVLKTREFGYNAN